MNGQVTPGGSYRIAREVPVEGGLAFAPGDEVVVESVAPDAANPLYKNVVYSQRLGRRFLLTDEDLEPAAPAAAPPVVAAQPLPPGAPPAGPQPGWQPAPPPAKPKGNRTVLIVALVVLVVLIATGLTLFFVLRGGDSSDKSPESTSTTGVDTIETGPVKAPEPGWKEFTGKGASLWLPGNYEGGNLEENLDAIVSQLQSLGPEYQKFVDIIKANPGAFAIFAYEANEPKGGFGNNVNVVTQKKPGTMTVQQYLDAVKGQLPSGFDVVEKKTVTVGPYKAGRLVIDVSVGGVSAKELMYVIESGGDFWVITYAVAAADYDKLAPVFEKSIKTFRVSK